MLIKRVNPEGPLSDGEIKETVEQAFAQHPVDNQRVLFIVPDSTRSMPMPSMFRALHEVLHGRVAKMDFLIALGTHPPMPDEAIHKMFGITTEERHGAYGDIGIYNHAWKDPETLARIGTISEEESAEISGGLLRESVEITVNKRVLDYDLVCIIGPVFPHEVVGFSGGNKYFFPGISGAEIVNYFHWLGALITNPMINGEKYTPVRQVVDRAAEFIPTKKACFALNIVKKQCCGIFFGSPEEAWSEAADLASETHVRYCDHAFDSVLAMAPEMYDDIWVAGKCMYKLEPVIADGGELIIYGPHIDEISFTHGEIIKKIGYHTRDYFLAQMDRFKDIPGGILAHSTHVRGIGEYVEGVEKPRVQVTLATAIPEDVCHSINLGYRDPATINPEDWRNRENEGRLLVENAGEILYRLKAGNPAPKPYMAEA